MRPIQGAEKVLRAFDCLSIEKRAKDATTNLCYSFQIKFCQHFKVCVYFRPSEPNRPSEQLCIKFLKCNFVRVIPDWVYVAAVADSGPLSTCVYLDSRTKGGPCVCLSVCLSVRHDSQASLICPSERHFDWKPVVCGWCWLMYLFYPPLGPRLLLGPAQPRAWPRARPRAR